MLAPPVFGPVFEIAYPILMEFWAWAAAPATRQLAAASRATAWRRVTYPLMISSKVF
jgi:hypothetical protein